MTELSLVASSGKVASPSPWRSPLGGRQSAPQHPLFTRLGLCRLCAGRRASPRRRVRGHHSDAQGGREGGEGFPEAWHVGLVPKGAQVSARQSRGPARPAEDTGDGAWCSRGNSGRTASARGPPPLPSPPPRPLRARVQPQGLSCLRPGAGCFSKTWVPLLQVTLISCPRNAEPSAWRFLLIQCLRPLPPGRCSRHPPLRAERGAGRAGSPGARLGGAESLDSTSLQTCHTVPRLRWGCGGSRGALFLL